MHLQIWSPNEYFLYNQAMRITYVFPFQFWSVAEHTKTYPVPPAYEAKVMLTPVRHE